MNNSNNKTNLFILLPTACYAQVDLVFIMDASTSITWINSGNWDIMKNFVKVIAGAFPIAQDATRVSVIKFSDGASVEFFLDQFSTSSEVSAAIDRISHTGGETNLPAALELLRVDVLDPRRGDRQNIKNIAIVITDGQTNVNEDRLETEIQMAKDANIEIFAIGITEDIKEEQLNLIASNPDQTFRATDFGVLDNILSDVIARACEVVPTFSPSPLTTPRTVVPEGGRKLISPNDYLMYLTSVAHESLFPSTHI